MIRDLRFALRLLAKSPAFSVTAVLLLAAGISSNTLIFSVMNALLLRPLPLRQPQNLVRLVEVHPNDFITWDLPYGFCETVAAQAVSLSEVLCQGEADVALRDGNATERVRVHLVSPNFFSSLGAGAALGRVLNPQDESSGARNAVLSYSFWQRRFGRDPAVLGRAIRLGGHAFTIIGVSAEGFNGLAVESSPDVRVPAAAEEALVPLRDYMNPAIRRHMYAQIFGRLRPGIPLERASRGMDGLLKTYEEELAQRFKPAAGPAPALAALNSHLRLESVAHGVSLLREQFSRGLEVAMAGVALLLAMACANVAGLMLARSAGRAQEIGVRLALGAAPSRIMRQLLAEGLLLAAAGGVAGAGLAWLCLPLVAHALPAMRDRAAVLQPAAVVIAIDWRVLAFAAAITLLTAVLCALSPAWRAARADVSSMLRGSRTTTRRLFPRQMIVAAQVALSTVILMGSVVLMETLARMQSMNAGFDRDHVATFTIDPSLRNYPTEQARALSRTLLEKAAAIPGVRAAAIASRAVMRGTGIKATFGAAGRRITPADFLNSSINIVTPEYFNTMGMEILAGCDFTWFDHNFAEPHAVVVNQAFARRFFPGKDPIGERFGFPGPGGIALPQDRIVGVVSDARYRSLREPIPPTVYDPAADGLDAEFILTVRTRLRPEEMMAPVRRLVHSLDPELPIVEARTLRAEVEASLWQERLLAWLAAAFGAIAVLLAGIGLYGALAYAVESRTREIGVRMALGARPGQIATLLARSAAWLVAGGTAAGLAVYGACAAGIQRVLYGVTAWELEAVAAVILLVLLLALGSTAPAAWRAAKTDAAAALRAE